MLLNQTGPLACFALTLACVCVCVFFREQPKITRGGVVLSESAKRHSLALRHSWDHEGARREDPPPPLIHHGSRQIVYGPISSQLCPVGLLHADPAAAESTGSDVSGSRPGPCAPDLCPQALHEPVCGRAGPGGLPGGDNVNADQPMTELQS